jgi:hypothetical protein
MQSPVSPKLKSKDVKKTRLALLESQGFKCAICQLPCDEEQAVLDHCHKGGWIRAVLHRACNAAEGKVMNSLRRYGIKDPQNFLRELMKYHEVHATNQTGLIHPLHFTPEEKLERSKAKAKKARAKAKAAKSAQ